ncbi:hypothetical protein C7266_01360 [Klebsiella variicola]|nr:hypothetical protein [Klebsiella variicola]
MSWTLKLYCILVFQEQPHSRLKEFKDELCLKMTDAKTFMIQEVGEYLLDMWWGTIKSSHEKIRKPITLEYDEALAVYAYTNCQPPFFEDINGALRRGEHHYLVDLIDSALEKLPVHSESVTYRWATIGNDLQLLLSKGVMTNLAYTSTNLQTRRYDGNDFDTDSMRIFMHLGRDISLYSDDNSLGLQEALIPRGASFRLLAQNSVPEFMYDLMQIV